MKRFKHSLIGKTNGDNRSSRQSVPRPQAFVQKRNDYSIRKRHRYRRGSIDNHKWCSRRFQELGNIRKPGPWSKNNKLSESECRARDRVVNAGDQQISMLREALLPPFKHGLNNWCYSVCTAKLVGTRKNKIFHHTDRIANKPSGVCTAKLANTVELQMAKRRTTKQPNTPAWNSR